MAKRKIEEKSLSIIERIVEDSLLHVGFNPTSDQSALLLRLIFSGIGSHFFFEPDTKFKIGFIEVMKSPEVDELFNVKIVRSPEDKIVNADTLYKYYKGDLARAEQLRDILDTFVNDLLKYAQGQEVSIASTVNRINTRKADNTKKKG